MVPLIDISDLDAGLAARQAMVRQIQAACADHGFFYISGHGIPPGMIADVLDQARAFFGQDIAARLAMDKRFSPCNRGYEPMGEQILEAGTPPDLKEGFYVGRDLPAEDPRVRAGLFNHGANQWPLGLPGFRPTMEHYIAAMSRLAGRVMRGIALSLDLEQDYFAEFCDDPMVVLRLLHYPPQPPNPLPGEKGCGAHTDWGTLTLLYQDDAGGLQMQTPSGWIDAPPMPGTFVVNLGDMMQRWTNDRYRSSMHRVINLSGRDRYSLPFFFEGSAQHLVTCLPSCASNDLPARYAPISVTDHLLDMYRRTYA